MTTDERRELIADLTTAANILPDDPYVTDDTYVKTLTRGECREILAMLGEAKFIAESLLTHDPYFLTNHEQALAERLIAAVGNSESSQHNLTDDVLEHEGVHIYTLRSDAHSVWVDVDNIAVYICRQADRVIVELLPNGDETAKPYDSCSASLKGDENA